MPTQNTPNWPARPVNSLPPDVAVDEPTRGKRTNMGAESNTTRLAIGAFYTAERLDAALIDLLGQQLTPREICLAGTREAFDRLVLKPANHTYDSRSAVLRVRPLIVVGTAPESTQVLATSGYLQTSILENGRRGGKVRARLVGSSDGVPRHLQKGAIAVVVSVPTPELQHRSSRVLLRHSDQVVETHEFTSA